MLSLTFWIVVLYSSFLPTIMPVVAQETLILHPQIPYRRRVPESFNARKLVRLNGIVLKNAYSFEIKLQLDGNTSALELLFDLEGDCMKSNRVSCRNCHHKKGDVLPLWKQQKFQIAILHDAYDFKVSVNGRHYCELPYTTPIKNIKYLSITGDVTIGLISWEEISYTIPGQIEPKQTVLYHGLIPDGLQQGKTLRFKGIAPRNGIRFAVNYLVSSKLNPWDDTPFYMNVRMSTNKVVLNTYQQDWGKEIIYELTVAPEELFEIVILPGANDYKVGINGEFYHTFPYRLALERCTHLLLEGDAAITLISWEGIVPPSQGYNPVNQHKQTPHSIVIPKGLTEGKQLTIQGVVPQNADGFFVNFQTSRELHPSIEIGLQVAVRLTQDYIGLNSFSDGIWGAEAYGKLHIVPGEQFEMSILPDTHEFKIVANEEHCGVFPYRITRSKMTHVVIYGDVTVTSISWNGGGL